MPPVLTKKDDELHLDLSNCRGYEFEDARAKIKEIAGRTFDWDTKTWIVEATPANADRVLKTVRPTADPDLMAWLREQMTVAEEALTTPLPDDADLLLPWATKRMPWQPEIVNDEPFNGLLPYQRAGVEALVAGDARTLLGDDMGLGKTIEAIAAVEEYRLQVELEMGTLPDGPKLIIAPASVKGSWKRELERWLDNPDVVVVKGSYSTRKATLEENLRLGHVKDKDGSYPSKLTADEVRRLVVIDGIERNAWVVVNWEQLRIVKVKKKLRNGGTRTVKQMKEPLFEDTEWLAVVADEIHRAKNKDALQTRGLWRVKAGFKTAHGTVLAGVQLGATGTPIMNSPDELWAPLAWLWPEQFNERGEAASTGAVPYWSFYNDYVDYWEDHYGKKVITGVKNPDALRFTLRGKLVRRTAAILGLLGRKRFFYGLDLNPKQQKLYDEAEKAMWLAVEKDIAAGNKDAIDFARAAIQSGSVANLIRIPNGAARLVRLQQVLENPALIGGDDDSAIMDDFEQKFEDSRPHPWVYFFKYKESCNFMAERLRKQGANVAVYNGDVDPAVRTKIEDKFQRGELDAICGTLDAMREGITLTRAHLMAFGTRAFVPAWNEQAEMRCDRLGQQELVRVYIPQPEDTVATDKVDVINRLKESIVRTVVPQQEIEEDHS